MDQNKSNILCNLYGSKKVEHLRLFLWIETSAIFRIILIDQKKVECLRYFVWVKTNWIFKIVSMDQHNLKTLDNLYWSEQVEYLR